MQRVGYLTLFSAFLTGFKLLKQAYPKNLKKI